MSLFNRLRNILRARLAEALREDRRTADWDADWDAGGSGPGAGSSGGDGGGVPGQDPRLAGWYANLELEYGADLEAVQAARKRLVRRYHPDLHSTDAEKQRVATELVQGLNQAYEGLKRHLE